MTRIDSHALPPPARPAQKPSAGHDNRQDFLEHLHADQPAAREPGARADMPCSYNIIMPTLVMAFVWLMMRNIVLAVIGFFVSASA